MLNKKTKNNWKNYCLFLLIIIGLTSGVVVPKHALYIGVVQIIHEEEEALTTIQVKVFSDDLQSVLQNDLGYEQVPSIAMLCETQKESIESYFKNHLEITTNQQTVDFQLVKCEQINDVHLLTFIAESENDWQTCTIDATFFMELFPLQSNIINFKYIPVNDIATQRMGRLAKGDNDLVFTL